MVSIDFFQEKAGKQIESASGKWKFAKSQKQWILILRPRNIKTFHSGPSFQKG